MSSVMGVGRPVAIPYITCSMIGYHSNSWASCYFPVSSHDDDSDDDNEFLWCEGGGGEAKVDVCTAAWTTSKSLRPTPTRRQQVVKVKINVVKVIHVETPAPQWKRFSFVVVVKAHQTRRSISWNALVLAMRFQLRSDTVVKISRSALFLPHCLNPPKPPWLRHCPIPSNFFPSLSQSPWYIWLYHPHKAHPHPHPIPIPVASCILQWDVQVSRHICNCNT